MMKTLIMHWTNECWVKNILEEGLIQLEGYNTFRWVKSGAHLNFPNQKEISLKNKLAKKQIKHTGRYVWFTEENKPVQCIGFPDEQVSFQFFAEDIGARKWVDVKKTIYSKIGRRIIRDLEKTAIRKGDDISKWWVLDKPVSIYKSSITHNTLERLVA